jgi:pimeloyl-ACP methyl ester carboxylesterase
MPLTDLHFESAGEGPAVVLLHSGVTDLRQWDPQWDELSARYQVVRCDRRGWGRSPLPNPSESASYSDAGDIVRLLDELGIEQAALVGSSAGGLIAQQIASAWPDRVSRLVLLCADTDGVEPTASIRSFAEREDRYLEDGAVDEAVELNVTTFLGPDATAQMRDLVRAMQRNAFEVQLAAGADAPREAGPVIDLTRATMPGFVVSGNRDLDYFALAAESLAQRLPDARRIMLPWAGHLPNLERPNEITALLLDALA